MKKLGIGLIGLGGISKKHIDELVACSDVEIVALCDVDTAALERARERLGVNKEFCFTDYRDLLSLDSVMAVEIMTPNDLHVKIAIDALRAGKHVNLEKPVALNYEDALELARVGRESGLCAMTCFSYRFKSAVRYAKRLVEEGKLGEVLGINVSYLKDSGLWEGRRLEWRFDKTRAGSGVIGDLAVHLIDLAQLLAGDITEVYATRSTVIKERRVIDGDKFLPVTTEDTCYFMAEFKSGARGTFHITRCAIGNKNTIKYDVYGTRGAISFNLNSPDEIDICIGEGDPKDLETVTVKVPKEYELDQERAFVNAVLGNRDFLFPTLDDGASGQLVVDSIIKSADNRIPVKIQPKEI